SFSSSAKRHMAQRGRDFHPSRQFPPERATPVRGHDRVRPSGHGALSLTEQTANTAISCANVPRQKPQRGTNNRDALYRSLSLRCQNAGLVAGADGLAYPCCCIAQSVTDFLTNTRRS